MMWMSVNLHLKPTGTHTNTLIPYRVKLVGGLDIEFLI